MAPGKSGFGGKKQAAKPTTPFEDKDKDKESARGGQEARKQAPKPTSAYKDKDKDKDKESARGGQKTPKNSAASASAPGAFGTTNPPASAPTFGAAAPDGGRVYEVGVNDKLKCTYCSKVCGIGSIMQH